jgi:hypothetical protein
MEQTVEKLLRHYATGRKVAGSRPDEVNTFVFLICIILPAALGSGFQSVSGGVDWIGVAQDIEPPGSIKC